MAFWHTDKVSPDHLALVDDRGQTLRWGELTDRVQKLAETIPPRTLVFIFCKNQCDTIIGYLACLKQNAVALMLDSELNDAMVKSLIDTYHPSYLWREEHGTFRLHATGLTPFQLHDDLALLMTTSGSTGSSKLVRLSQRNLESNATSIANYLAIDSKERGLASLPLNYVYGLSIVNSHLKAGATLLLTSSVSSGHLCVMNVPPRLLECPTPGKCSRNCVLCAWIFLICER